MSLNIDESTSGLKANSFCWKSIWNLCLPTKVQIFLWKCCHDWLPTNVNLARSHVRQQMVAAQFVKGILRQQSMLFGLAQFVLLMWLSFGGRDRQGRCENVKWKPPDVDLYKLNTQG
ncbi:hypothetical protein QYF36_001421 [Acer negundo]|nr:hypothetical protein QYF36_001421 [Acer negundo]